ncbi:hypothetical protein GGX14DRAFT_634939 [Mycena pura]|uniref:SWIM-type domain-containing protein n=1 Tax=Mycena pura TaxID=153505 RepID=A0AAD6VFA3_9AGAR|nr:hypothetical protein GGX14DRAFT_634939 [Mycena pura]
MPRMRTTTTSTALQKWRTPARSLLSRLLLARPYKACLAFLRARRDPHITRIQRTRYQPSCCTSGPTCFGANHLRMAASLLAPPKYGLQVSSLSQALPGARPVLWRFAKEFIAGLAQIAADGRAPLRQINTIALQEQQRAAALLASLASRTPLPISPTLSQEERDRDYALHLALGDSPPPSPPATSYHLRRPSNPLPPIRRIVLIYYSIDGERAVPTVVLAPLGPTLGKRRHVSPSPKRKQRQHQVDLGTDSDDEVIVVSVNNPTAVAHKQYLQHSVYSIVVRIWKHHHCDLYSCNCPDFPMLLFCKHIAAVQRLFDESAGPESTLFDNSPTPLHPTPSPRSPELLDAPDLSPAQARPEHTLLAEKMETAAARLRRSRRKELASVPSLVTALDALLLETDNSSVLPSSIHVPSSSGWSQTQESMMPRRKNTKKNKPSGPNMDRSYGAGASSGSRLKRQRVDLESTLPSASAPPSVTSFSAFPPLTAPAMLAPPSHLPLATSVPPPARAPPTTFTFVSYVPPKYT